MGSGSPTASSGLHIACCNPSWQSCPALRFHFCESEKDADRVGHIENLRAVSGDRRHLETGSDRILLRGCEVAILFVIDDAGMKRVYKARVRPDGRRRTPIRVVKIRGSPVKSRNTKDVSHWFD